MKEMMAYSDEEMKKDLREAIGCGERKPTLEEFILYMYGATHRGC